MVELVNVKAMLIRNKKKLEDRRCPDLGMSSSQMTFATKEPPLNVGNSCLVELLGLGGSLNTVGRAFSRACL